MLRRIDALSYSNALRHLSPLWKSLFAVVMFILSYSLHPVLQVIIFFWMMLWCIHFAKIPARTYGSLLCTALLFFVLSLPAVLVELGRPEASDAVLALKLPASEQSLYVMAAGIRRAGKLLARVIACLSCFFFLILTTPFGELLQVLRKLRLPEIVLELMLIMYRFLFLLSDTVHGMLLAGRLRGGKRGFWARMREMAGMGSALFANTMRRYDGLSKGLLTRGYTGQIVLPPYEPRTVPGKIAASAYIGIALMLLAELWIRLV
ncbi:cobalt ECF transporter T component CbiQ [Paenibacillus sp. M1]|uniref:Cobalt ECF transporter T component CbiQ n=1 Tax=Paenibacillus haidiansis TaxID=1574488 RepID=A0ABU7VUB9_9BACL